jgi:hypothetical protein
MSRKIGAAVAALALAGVPALAQARPPGHDENHAAHGHRVMPRAPRAAKPVVWVVAGPVKAVDAGAHRITVTIRQANRHRRALRGRDVIVDLTAARLHVRDVNGDGLRDLGDVAVGDRALVLARLPRNTMWDPATAYPAKHVVVRHRMGYVDPFAP